MKKLRILLAGNLGEQNYVSAVEGVGAEAVFKYLPEADTSYDGLILCGGNDIDPKYYGEEIDGSVEIDAERDAAELELLRAFVRAGKPVLGICRGHQLINVFFGGTLYQHLPDAEVHARKNNEDMIHGITSVCGSVLHTLYGEKLTVNSAHHQAVKLLGEGLRATAYCDGGHVEAFEHCSLPILGVQFHPERMCFENAREDTVCGEDIFKHFISICEKNVKTD
ncbi:MAG: type 1 glutamine amidotransferase [Clostridia bacterium]|nr:type 1 glutamine amidotransferase [Clostridia bacterium]